MITYNGEKFVKQQIESILKQLDVKDELIISDDSSTDSTINIIEEINDSRIKLLKNNKFKNPTFNMENALKFAKGDYIIMSDQDDVWTDDKVRVVLEYLQVYDYVVSDCYITDGDLNIKSETRFLKEANIATNKYLALVRPTPYQGSCAAFNKKVLEKSLPFPKHIQSHDRWIGYIASFFFKYKIIPEKLIYYRRHDNNVSTSSTGKSKNSFIQKMKYRLGYIIGILSRI
ncbi:glycosyltransferase [Empedobacter falsenii]